MIASFGEFGMWPLSWGATVMLDYALEKSEDARLPREIPMAGSGGRRAVGTGYTCVIQRGKRSSY